MTLESKIETVAAELAPIGVPAPALSPLDAALSTEKKEHNSDAGDSSPSQGSIAYASDEAARLQAEREAKYLTGTKLLLVFVGMLLSVLLIALDQTILAPALPVIASKFSALDNIAWIASAYFLTQSACMLLYGQALTVFDRKWSYIFAIFLFELGSLLCGVAPTVNVLILGRAVAGCGAGGIFVAVLSIIAEISPLEDRPKLLGTFGGVFGISSVIGPLLGGAFTDKVSWRWCFYINLPLGAITIASICFILGPQPAPPMRADVETYTASKIRRWTFGKLDLAPSSFLFRFLSLDWVGSTILLGTITCLLLPLQWGGGVKYAWSDGPIIGLFVAFAALVVIFVVYEWKFAGPSCCLPLRFFKNRTQVGACLAAFFLMFCMLVSIYYLPIFYQATKGVTATKSGINILPFMLALVVAAGLSGGVITKFGRYWPFLVGSPVLICIGGGLLYTIDEFTPSSRLIGFQILLGLGIGGCLQQTIIAVQADTANPDDVPQTTGLVTFTQLIGGTVGIAIASTIFGGQLATNLHKFAPTADFDLVRNSVEAITTIPLDQRAGVIHAYVKALQIVFIISVPAGALTSIVALLVRNLSVKGMDLSAGAA